MDVLEDTQRGHQCGFPFVPAVTMSPLARRRYMVRSDTPARLACWATVRVAGAVSGTVTTGSVTGVTAVTVSLPAGSGVSVTCLRMPSATISMAAAATGGTPAVTIDHPEWPAMWPTFPAVDTAAPTMATHQARIRDR